MPDFTLNDYLLYKEAESLAAEIFREVREDHIEEFDAGDCLDYMDEMNDLAHETADGHEWVIYTYKAHTLCLHCNTDMGEERLEECGMPEEVTYDTLGCLIACGELRGRIDAALNDLCAEHAPE